MSHRTCSSPNCHAQHHSKGLCNRHYYQFRSKIGNGKSCIVLGCNRVSITREYCEAHYRRFLRYGDPLGGSSYKGEPLSWLRSAVLIETNECIDWPYGKSNNGRGTVHWEGKNRIVYHIVLILVGRKPPLPPLETRHTCGRGRYGCINPAHLIVGTHQENTEDRLRDGQQTHKLTNDQVISIFYDTRSIGR